MRWAGHEWGRRELNIGLVGKPEGKTPIGGLIISIVGIATSYGLDN
jgi:hypothetical protein